MVESFVSVEFGFLIIAAGIGYFGGMLANYIWWYLQKGFEDEPYILHILGIFHLLAFLAMFVGAFLVLYYQVF